MSEPAPRRGGSIVIAVVTLALLAVTVVALLTATRPPPDRVQDLAQTLRCPVCKSVSIAESPSETAVAMRQVVAEQVAAGRSDDEIVAFFRARYGEWVLLDPPTRGATLALWLVPPVVVVLGAALVLTRPRAWADPGPELDGPDRARVDAAVTRTRNAEVDQGHQP